MHKLLAIAALVLVLWAFQVEAGEKELVVTKVIDGNTIVLENGDIVRYAGIDAPHLKKSEGGPSSMRGRPPGSTRAWCC